MFEIAAFIFFRYNSFAKPLLNWYKANAVKGDKKASLVQYNSDYAAYKQAYEEEGSKYSKSDIEEEMVADAIAALYNDAESVNNFVNYALDGMSDTEQKSFIDAVKDFFKTILDKIKALIDGSDLNSYQQRVLQMQEKEIKNTQKLLNKAFVQARQNAAVNDNSDFEEIVEENTDISIKSSINPDFNKEIDRWYKGGKNPNEVFVLGTTSDVLQGLGARENDIYINADKIITILDEHPEMSIDDIKKIPTIIDNSLLVLSSKNLGRSKANTRLVLYGNVKNQTGSILSVLDLLPVEDSIMIDDLQKVNSAYVKTIKPVDFIEKSKVLYVTKNNKKANSLLRSIGFKIPIELQQSGFLGSITYKGRSVNIKGVDFDDVFVKNNTTDNNSMQNSKKYSLNVDSEGKALSNAQAEFFKDVASELRDRNGNIKPFYHGTSRADRVGNYFNPSRATSGPMAYFTDNEEIASNYSRAKADTSLAYDNEYDSYETQFRVNVNGESMPIVDYWYTLSLKEKNNLTEKIKQVTYDDDYETIILDTNNKYGIGNFNDYEMRYAKGNALQVLVDGWLGGGTLFGEEEKFLEVLDKIGITDVEYKNPNYREEKVYKCYLNITNPLNTDNLDQEFIDDLTDYADSTDMSIYEKETANSDLWDKNNIDVYEWIDRLQDDLDNGTTHAWTSIPDIVTDFLKEYGKYDGIIDKGGKGGGIGHIVAIPFYSNQIKAVDNLNPTENEDIRYSKRVDVDNFDESQYSVINTTGRKGYKRLKSEVMTWDDVKHPDEVRCISLASSGFYIYKMLDNETKDILVYIPRTANGKKQRAFIRKLYHSRAYDTSVSVSRLIEDYRNSGIDNSELSGSEQRKSGDNADVDVEQIREKGNNNTGGVIENDNNDNLQKGRQSVNVDELLKEFEQIKAVDNLNPTENEDIRYSKRVDTTIKKLRPIRVTSDENWRINQALNEKYKGEDSLNDFEFVNVFNSKLKIDNTYLIKQYGFDNFVVLAKGKKAITIKEIVHDEKGQDSVSERRDGADRNFNRRDYRTSLYGSGRETAGHSLRFDGKQRSERQADGTENNNNSEQDSRRSSVNVDELLKEFEQIKAENRLLRNENKSLKKAKDSLRAEFRQ